ATIPCDAPGRARHAASGADPRGGGRVSMQAGQYAFVPWIKAGVGAEIGRVDGTPGGQPRVSLSVQVRFNGDPALSDGVTLALYGPGGGSGFDTRTVVATWSKRG